MRLNKKIMNLILIHNNKNKNLIKIYKKKNKIKNIIKFNRIIFLKEFFLNFLNLIKKFKNIKIIFFLIWKSHHFKNKKKVIKNLLKIKKNYKIKIKKNIGRVKNINKILNDLK